ncbi:MAG: hypothetical protein R3C05_18405 [Pirellulaceae bacterium]
MQELQLAASFRDDFGLLQYGLSYALAGGDENVVVLGDSAIGKQSHEGGSLIDFESLEAQPDQLLTYHFWAEDRDASGEIRHVQGDLYFAEVRHFEEIFRQGEQPPGGQQQQQQGNQNSQQAEELAELQKQIVSGTWNVIRREASQSRNASPDDKVSEKLRDDVRLLNESQQSARDQLQQLAHEVSDPQSKQHVAAVDAMMETAISELTSTQQSLSMETLQKALSAEQAAYQGLLKLRAREFEVSRQQQSQSQSQSSSSSQRQLQQQLDELELKNDENRYETQQQAQSQEDEQAGQIRQILNRLKELAQRQEDLNQQLKQLQSALETAETEEAREQIERQLKRLREEQQELLRDTDELADKLNQSANQEAAADQQDQLSQTRENVRQANEALSQQNVAEALSAGTRAEREFKQMRDEVREQAANSFSQTMRQMQQQAEALQEQQQSIDQQISDLQESKPGELRGGVDRENVQQQISEQKDDLNDLLQAIEQTVTDAEATEPLLAEKLYDAFRKTKQRQVDERLDMSRQLLQRSLDEQSLEMIRTAGEGISDLKKQIDEASESILGDPSESLRRALGELEDASAQLQAEIQRNDPNAPSTQSSERPSGQEDSDQSQSADNPASNETRQPGQQQPGQQQPGQQQPGQQQPGQQQPGQQQPGQQQPGQQQPGQQQPGQQQPGQQQPGQQQPGQQQPGQQQPGQQQPGQQQPGQQQPGHQQPGQQQPGQTSSSGRGGGNVLQSFAESMDRSEAAPLTGEGFRQWSDQLRDVEELVDDPELRSQAARIREAARRVRTDLKRHNQSPQWDMVRRLIAEPLEELKQHVSEELLRRSADRNALVPIDRDPVPTEFAEQVEKYYEKLGRGK